VLRGTNRVVDEWIVEPLDGSHIRGIFACGRAPLDTFLRTLVTQYEKRRLGRTYVATAAGEKRAVGYYTLASSAVAFETLPQPLARKLPRHPIPVILIARLAVDREARGQGLGRHLLVDAMKRCLGLADRVGIHAIEVEAIDHEASTFYKKYGFVALADRPHHLFMPLATVQLAFGD
jgi:GNAT superfamily N-acetyltransferase